MNNLCLNLNHDCRVIKMSDCADITNILTELNLYNSKMNTLPTEDLVTIEGLRSLYASCFTCGVNWSEDQVSLDCRECGDYAMQRPCPRCDGKCQSVWRRNLSLTHDSQKAIWDGDCKLNNTHTNQKTVSNISVTQSSFYSKTTRNDKL